MGRRTLRHTTSCKQSYKKKRASQEGKEHQTSQKRRNYDDYLTAKRVTAALEELVLPLEIPERANVREGQRKAELVFIAHRSQRKAAIFHADAAAIPVV